MSSSWSRHLICSSNSVTSPEIKIYIEYYYTIVYKWILTFRGVCELGIFLPLNLKTFPLSVTARSLLGQFDVLLRKLFHKVTNDM